MNRVNRNKNKDYTVVSNVFLRDKNLSLKAKGFLAVVMGLPDDWEFTINGICEILKDGKTSIYSTINELKDNGYCKVEICRNEKGVILGNDYSFFETPNSEKQYNEKPYSENPNMDNQPQLNTYINNNLNNKVNNNKEDTKVSKKAKSNWREDIEIYIRECEEAKNTLAEDKECEQTLLRSYPNADYYRTILKSLEFWESERGWEYKKKSKAKNINMVSTIKKNLDKSIVYKNRQNAPIENERLLHIRKIDDEGTLADGTIFKMGHRYYFSNKDKKTYSIPVDALERPDDRWEFDLKGNQWYLPEEKEGLDDLLW